MRSASFLLVAILVYIGAVFTSSWYVGEYDFTNANTNNSNLFFIQSDTHYDLMVTGISHARMLSRDGNHYMVENMLGKNIINMGVGGSKAGFVNLELYMRYFFEKGNNVDELLYVLSPSMMFSNFIDNSSDAFVLEPFDLRFAKILVLHGYKNKWEQLFYYTRSKLNSMWIGHRPNKTNGNFAALDSINHKTVQQGMQLAYLEGQDEQIFQERKRILASTLKYLISKDVKVTFIIPPALFGKWNGHNQIVKVLKEFEREYGIRYYDYSEIMMEPRYYYDHHHLNTNGVELFTEDYLKPIFNSNTTSVSRSY